MRRFDAKCITYRIQDGIVIVAFADDALETTQYLLIQRTLNPEQEDVVLGHDKAYVELGSQQRSAYGAIASAQLADDVVQVNFNERGLQATGYTAVKVALVAENVDFAALAEHLALAVGESSWEYGGGTTEP